LKSQSKLEAQLEKKLKEDPENDAANDGLKTVRAALDKTTATIKEDPQKEWDAEKSAKVAEATKELSTLKEKVAAKDEEKEIIATTVDKKSGVKKELTVGEV